MFTCQDVVRAIKLGWRLDFVFFIRFGNGCVCFFLQCIRLVRRINYPDLFSWHCIFLHSFFLRLHHAFRFKQVSCVLIDNIIRVLTSNVSVAFLSIYHGISVVGLYFGLPMSVTKIFCEEVNILFLILKSVIFFCFPIYFWFSIFLQRLVSLNCIFYHFTITEQCWSNSMDKNKFKSKINANPMHILWQEPFLYLHNKIDVICKKNVILICI